MKQVSYESSAAPFSFDIPSEWNIEDLSGVNFECHDTSGNEVIASEAATMYTETTLDGDVSRYADTFVLTAAAADLNNDDMLTLIGSLGRERVIVDGYDATTKTVKSEMVLENDYEDGDRVLGNVITHEIDVSDTDVFTAGKQFVVTWTPVGTGVPFKETFQITKFKADTSDIERRFQYLYPRAYKAFVEPVDRMADMIDEAEVQLEFEMRSCLMDMHRIVGETLFPQLLMAKMACLWVINADEDLDDERKALNTDFTRLFALMKQLPIWTDSNQDGVKNDSEISSHNHLYLRSW